MQAEDQSLRRLERDIHDGPQQRLVRLQMDLASAERSLERDPEAARALLGEARGQAHDTLEELRALSRGFAPPILQDRGLVAGLESLAARSPIPVEFVRDLSPELVLAPEVERSAYFVAAELLTNVAKHSGADGIRLELSDRSDGRAGRELVLRVEDNGTGGASFEDGHGLRGLADRLGGLLGELSVESPDGGPTRVTARVPLGR
ncbi:MULTISPECIES: sensor histidine kinase [unclassified Leucobacter]|uniref:sensor histidine kinase n=1 Tax=unclassified Leucobacter TaxID=2621730 RepID=UPI0021127B7A|nr:histidine kinase [Leucobacter sp. CX169]